MGINMDRMCLHEANDIIVVLGGTFRAISMDDFQDYLDGREKEEKTGIGGRIGGTGGKEEVSVPAFMNMIRKVNPKSK